ncbi:MAG: FAD-dependent oxidoreductase [Pseudomonadota bacterium]
MNPTVAVVGAGLVGASAALALARQGFHVQLLDRQAPQRQTGRLGMDIRNVALSPASRALLTELGVWPEKHAATYRHMHVWEQWGTSHLHFSAADAQREELGWLVEMSPLALELWQHCEARPGVDVQLAEIKTVSLQDDAVTLSFADHSQQSFDFVLAADGARSAVRTALELAVQVTPTNQVALATVVQTERPHDDTAWQRFLIDGPLALLPGTNPHLSSVVWSQSAAAAERRLQLRDEDFLTEIGAAIEHRLGRVVAVDQRLTFPLSQQRINHCNPHPRLLFIGDALRVVHPLAGLGVNLGFEDVVQFMRVASRQPDLAAPGLWQKFNRQRQARSTAMIGTLDLLRRFYALDNPGGTLLRNAGVSAFNALPGLKRQVMYEAMGLGPLSQ